MKQTRWLLRPPARPLQAQKLSQESGLPLPIAAILCARGLFSLDELNPELKLLAEPALFEAARQIIAAIKNKKRIRIHGDYDADGVTATSILLSGLRELGGDVHGFVPNRLSDGYGLHPDRVEEHAAACDLLVTVDCGVSNLAEIARLIELGCQVIITDHHALGPTLPGCLVVHSLLSKTLLTGAGLAYHLLWAIRQELKMAAPIEYADLAAIGTIADVAALQGDNRALVKLGLQVICQSRWPGLRLAVEEQKLTAVSARQVAFLLAPRLNAAGRLGEADLALELLTSNDEPRVAEILTFLEKKNSERRQIQDKMFKEALCLIDRQAPAIVITKDDWHPGVMGIVASKILETVYKPVFIVAQGKGSVRSTPGISAVAALREAKDHLQRFGGHRAAAGFALAENKFRDFQKSILEFTAKHEIPVEEIVLDAILNPEEVNLDLQNALEKLEPCGEGHPKALFFVRSYAENVKMIGKNGEHLSCNLGKIKTKRWNSKPIEEGTLIDAAVVLDENNWRGQKSIEFLAESIKKAGNIGVLGENCQIHSRIKAQTALESLKLQAKPVFARGPSLAYLKEFVPDTAIHETTEAVKELIIFAMPETELLTAWVEQKIQLTFALTLKTLEELEKTAIFLYGIAGEEINAYRLSQFARYYRITDDAGFSKAVQILFSK